MIYFFIAITVLFAAWIHFELWAAKQVASAYWSYHGMHGTIMGDWFIFRPPWHALRLWYWYWRLPAWMKNRIVFTVIDERGVVKLCSERGLNYSKETYAHALGSGRGRQENQTVLRTVISYEREGQEADRSRDQARRGERADRPRSLH